MEEIKQEILRLYGSFDDGMSAQTRTALVDACASLRLSEATEALAASLREFVKQPFAIEAKVSSGVALSGKISIAEIGGEVTFIEKKK